MLRVNWIEHKTLTNDDEFKEVRNSFISNKQNIIAGAFDTETDGLHIKQNKPFLLQFGWITSDLKGYTYAVDFEVNYNFARRVVIQWNALASTLPIYLGHNIKFDLHMLHNLGNPYNFDNVSDTMMWIRLSTAAVPTRKGGVPLGLKDFASQYITRDANTMEKKLKEEKTEISKALNEKLKKKLGWTKKKIDEFFKDKLHDANDLPEKERKLYYQWFDELPEWLKDKVHGAVDSDDIPYNHLNRENVIYYAHLDIVWTIEVWLRCKDVVANHGNMEAMNLENALIQPLVEVERVGLAVDRDYLINCKDKLKQYILTRRKDLNMIAGEELKCSQSERIKQLAKEKFGIELETTASEQLTLLVQDIKHTDADNPIIEFIETIQELRTLEKWYATYLMRFMDSTKYEPKLYTSMNQAGTVSGRFTSDLQQFPKAGIVDIEGNELFNPRKMIIVPKEYSSMVFIDESGLELRTQAAYTVLVSGGDVNMCRAYCPFRCHNKDGIGYVLGEKFKGDWYRDEDDTLWTPTDLHSETTKLAFDITEDHPDFHDLRYKGKRVNFCKQYGGGFKQIKAMFPEYEDAQLRKIDDAYYKAFPEVKAYQEWVYQEARQSAYVENLFGVKYWGADGHHLINMLVQGSGAYFMKLKLLEQVKFLKEHNCKSKMFLQIHRPSQLWI